MRRPTIAIDCDDVLVPTAESILRVYERTYGIAVPIEQFYTSNPVIWGTSSIEEACSRVSALLGSAELTTELEPLQGAIAGVRALARAGHELHMVTGRPSELEGATRDMAQKYFSGLFSSIHLTNHFVAGKSRSKGQVCTEIGADILVDDHVVHIDSVLVEGGLQEAIVFGDYPWNQQVELGAGAVRCANWQAAVQEIGRIADQ